MSEVKYVICNSCKRKIEAFYHEYSGKIVIQHCLICNNEIKFINPKMRVFFTNIQKVKTFEYKTKDQIKDFGIVTMEADLESFHGASDAFN